jgi:glycosyltransferase involved in cell wall biosynthesis
MENESPTSTNIQTTPSLLIVGQTPPPWHGQAVATKILFDHDWGHWEVRTLRMAYSEEMHSVGRMTLGKIFHLLWLIRETRRILREGPETILFYPPASANWIPFLRDVAYLCGVRRKTVGTVFIFHASGLAEWVSKSWLRRCLALKAYGNADLALEVAIESVSPHEMFLSNGWEWCPCAAEVPAMERSVPTEGKRLEALFVGSLQEGKGILEIVKTAAILKERGLADRFRLKVVGRWFSDEFKRETEGLIAELGVGDIVLLAGELTGEAKWQAYREADVFFFPSHYQSEASPIVLMEALGAGLPVVSTKWRGIPTLLEGCESGWLLPIKSPGHYADTLIDLSARRREFPRFAESSRRFYESRYRPEHFTGRIERALDRRWPCPDSQADGGKMARREPSGEGVCVLQVFNQYAEQGGEEVWVDQMTTLGDGRLKIHELRFQSRVWKIHGAPSRLAQAWRMWDNPESRRRLRREVSSLRPDVLLFHNLIPVASFGLYEEARHLGIPVLQYIHNFRPFSPSGTLWHGGQVRDEALRGNSWPEVMGRSWERSFPKTALLAIQLHRLRSSGWLDAVDQWIAVSEFMRMKFIEAGIPETKITTLHHCWTPQSDGAPPLDGDYYLFLGRLVPEKGVGTLLEAWRQLEKRLGKACPRLVIAGTGPEEAKVIGSAKVSRCVEFAGFVSGEAKNRLLRGCRAVIAPSIWWEPLGLIVYEAYDYGKPVIAARSGGLVETVREGDGGYLHEPGNCESLVEAVMKLEKLDPDERIAMGRTGRNWLVEHASPEAWKASFMKIIEKASNA